MPPRSAVKLADVGKASKKIFALDAILMPHPQRERVTARVGRDQRGNYWKFEQVSGTWRPFERCTDSEIENVTQYYGNTKDECQYEYRPGPSTGWVLLYHITEPP